MSGRSHKAESLPLAALLERADNRAGARRRTLAAERDLATVVLRAAGLEVAEPARVSQTPSPRPLVADSPTGTTSRAASGTALDRFGTDLTAAAREGLLIPVVGRENEITVAVETLLRHTKPNPLLVGPAGSGKTAIVEGIACRIAAGDVPEQLKGRRLVAVSPSSLVAGSGVVGELEKRMKAILEEASAGDVLLFIDEFHSMIGAGGMQGTSDAASILKPALARGDFACIAATTDDEYRRYVERDGALARRFQPIRVQELTQEETLDVLRVHRDRLSAERGVAVADDVLSWIVSFAADTMPNRTFPDKAIDLLENCVANAVVRGEDTVSREASEAVAKRMVGVVTEPAAALGDLEDALARQGCAPEDARAVLDRLKVTLRGLDLRRERPNCVIVLAGAAAPAARPLATTIARVLFGAGNRVTEIDFGGFAGTHDLSGLLGSPAGYVGYEDRTPLQDLAQSPRSVLVCDNLDLAHPVVREVVAQALDTGHFTDAAGRRVHLGDCVVILTCAGEDDGPRESRPAGFLADTTTDTPGSGARDTAEALLGPALAAEADIVLDRLESGESSAADWLQREALPALVGRYGSFGARLEFDTSVVGHLAAELARDPSRESWEKTVDEQLTVVLVDALDGAGHAGGASAVVAEKDGAIVVDFSAGATREAGP